MGQTLYDDPDLYDALLPTGPHLAHYGALADRQPGDVLELACGSGQITVGLARAGRTIVGLDLSPPMLDAARRRAEKAGVRDEVQFVESDMRSFDLQRRFSLIFIARNSMLHLHETADFLALFAAVRRHLAPGGVFAFDIFNPDVRILARPSGERAELMRVSSPAHGELLVEWTGDYDSARQVNRATWFVSTPAQRDAWVVPVHLRSVFAQELALLLAAGGLRLVSRAGDFAGGHFSGTSRHQVCICEPA